jgi:hypothetical protein
MLVGMCETPATGIFSGLRLDIRSESCRIDF